MAPGPDAPPGVPVFTPLPLAPFPYPSLAIHRYKDPEALEAARRRQERRAGARAAETRIDGQPGPSSAFAAANVASGGAAASVAPVGATSSTAKTAAAARDSDDDDGDGSEDNGSDDASDGDADDFPVLGLD